MIQSLTALPRLHKRLVIALCDYLACLIAFEAAMALRLQYLPGDLIRNQPVVAIYFLVYLMALRLSGAHMPVLRHSGWASLAQLFPAFFYYLAVAGMVTLAGWLPGIPRTLGIIHAFLFFTAIAAIRLLAGTVLRGGVGRDRARRREAVLIYGADQDGVQLDLALSHRRQTRVVGFVDSDRHLWGRTLNGKKVYPPARLDPLIDRHAVSQVLVAPAALRRRARLELAERLRQRGVEVRILPELSDIATGKVDAAQLHDIDIGDILGREMIAPDEGLMDARIAGRVVLVTGAGGSIGSELCRQILRRRPATLLLVEHGEFALYEIHRELLAMAEAADVDIVPLLGSVCDRPRIASILAAWQPQTIFHAAAYKHVPLVEHNCLDGITNNVLGTLAMVVEAERHGVADFVLISTDKAVRPTNVMGCTKRVAELILQARAGMTRTTCFSMVRFGNVLGSSGSVVPVFRRQIAQGGPVTVTHRDMTRYFMTIPEAAQLVIQAGAMARSGEVFLLDMGEPVRIFDLACNMVRLCGLTVRDAAHPDGDIEIIEIGMRPGEKLYEELLISVDPEPTRHPLIFKAREHSLAWPELEARLAELQRCIARRDPAAARAVLCAIVPEYRPAERVHDLVLAAEAAAEGEAEAGQLPAIALKPEPDLLLYPAALARRA